MSDYQQAKSTIRKLYQDFDTAPDADLIKVLTNYVSPEYHWRGMHPFDEIHGAENVIDTFWRPLKESFASLNRREDIFFAGYHHNDPNESVWVVSMGNFMGLFDKPWLGIRPTNRIVMIRYAEFHRVESKTILETALFIDILSVIQQAGQYPLGPMTGVHFVYPGPKTHDGILLNSQDSEEGAKTIALVNKMVDDLGELNRTGEDRCPPEYLARTWNEDMIWYGPCGIGASFTIERYQQQHQYPFRENLADKVFNGHIARVSEGKYCGFFGWPNLNNRNMGGFMNLPASDVHAPMRVTDIYRREGDKLAENWVFIDMLHYLNAQGLNVLDQIKN